jgi:hypothetical protein
MAWVNMTVFITHCWKSVQLKLNGMARTGLWLRALCVGVFFWAAFVGPSHAQSSSNSQVEVSQLRLERSEGALLLQSTLRLDLSSTIEDALQKGMPIYCAALPLGLPTPHPHVAFECVARTYWRGGLGQ